MSAITETAVSARRKPIPRSKRPLPKSKHIGLRVQHDQKVAWHRLPSVGRDHSSKHSASDVPMSSGFFGGIDVGKAIAQMYLNVRTERDNLAANTSSLLSSMLSALIEKQPSPHEEEQSLTGQRVGFLYELSYWLDAAMLQQGSSSDASREQSFVEQANASLLKDNATLMALMNVGGDQ